MITTPSSSLLATAIALHTVEEALQIPAYQRAYLGSKQPNTVPEVLLDSLPIFLLLPLAAWLQPTLVWITDTLATVAVLHPLMDHVALALHYNKQRRPGSATALGMLLPLGVLHAWQRNFNHRTSLVGVAVGAALSLFLYVVAKSEIEASLSASSVKA
ncbi:MAG: hypothetical protein SGARI_000561 [Bacillariaceae sp.]